MARKYICRTSAKDELRVRSVSDDTFDISISEVFPDGDQRHAIVTLDREQLANLAEYVGVLPERTTTAKWADIN